MNFALLLNLLIVLLLAIYVLRALDVYLHSTRLYIYIYMHANAYRTQFCYIEKYDDLVINYICVPQNLANYII